MMARITQLGRFNAIVYCLITLFLCLAAYNIFSNCGEGPRIAVLVRGRRPRANTTVRGPVTMPIENNETHTNKKSAKEREWDGVIHERKRVLDAFCKADGEDLYNQHVSNHILISVPKNIAMCFVPKTGCTFWKRLIYKLQISDGGMVENLFDIGKRKIHSMPIRRLSYFQTISSTMKFWNNSTRVIFARDPYSRLFSAYVDKFFLPDFWAAGQGLKRKAEGPNSQITSCGHDATFEEFLRYVFYAEDSGDYFGYTIDDHWMPVSRICQPCAMTYDIVAKQETFSSDRDWILEKYGLNDILPQNEAISRDVTAKDAMNQTIDTYWGASEKENPCVTQLELMHRFWRSYQIQGYLPSSLVLPEDQLSPQDGSYKESFRRVAMETYDKHKLSRTGYKDQRRQEMVSAYKKIPADLMQKIQDHFKKDFEMFSYDIRPSYLYE